MYRGLTKGLRYATLAGMGLGCKEDYTIPQPMEAQLQGIDRTNTTVDGKQAFLLIGDSKNAISDDTDQNSPSPILGTAWQWDHTINKVTPLTSTDLVNAGTVGTKRGSPWPQFCMTYNSLTQSSHPGGLKPVIVDGHLYGSYIYNTASSTLSWGTNGTTYTTAVSRANACIGNLGLTKLKGIMVIIGANDNGSAEAIGNVSSGLTSLIDRLRTDFGSDTPIYITMMGTDNNTPTARTGTLRSNIRDLSSTYSNVYEYYNENSLFSLGLMAGDLVHWKQAGNNLIGTKAANFIVNNNSDDKDVRRVLNYFYNDISVAKQNAIRKFILSEKAAGNLSALDMLQIYVADTENNILLDWIGRTSPLKPSTPYTFNANTNISTNGSSTYMRCWYAPSQLAKYATQDNIIMGFGCGTMTTAAGTAATAMGGTSGVSAIAQDASSRTNFQISNATAQTYTTDTKLQSNTDYAVWRTTSTNLELFKNGSIVSTKSVASNAFGSVMWDIGCKNNSNPDTPTSSSYYNGEWKYAFSGAANSINYSRFLTDIAALLTVLSVNP